MKRATFSTATTSLIVLLCFLIPLGSEAAHRSGSAKQAKPGIVLFTLPFSLGTFGGTVYIPNTPIWTDIKNTGRAGIQYALVDAHTGENRDDLVVAHSLIRKEEPAIDGLYSISPLENAHFTLVVFAATSDPKDTGRLRLVGRGLGYQINGTTSEPIVDPHRIERVSTKSVSFF